MEAPKVAEIEKPRFFDVVWVEADRYDELVMRRKEFTSEKAQLRFIAQVEKKDNFIRLEHVYSYA